MEKTTKPITIQVNPRKKVFKYIPAQAKAHVGDEVVFNCQDGDFAVKFGGLTPFEKTHFSSRQGVEARARVRDGITYGHYKYTVAVAVEGQILIDDPDILIEE
jgi:plastocyanin